MIQLIALSIFIVSLAVVVFMLNRKIPVLVKLPQDGHHGLKKHKIILNTEKKIKDFHFNFFKKQIYLHKFLLIVKVLTLKIETKIDALLHGIRKKAQQLDKEINKKK